jgi:hypothetical protein
MPETSIEEMKYGMLSTANIAIHFSPIFHDGRIDDGLGIFWIHIPQIIPARTSPLRHRVGLSFSNEIISESYIDPIRNSRKRGLSIT